MSSKTVTTFIVGLITGILVILFSSGGNSLSDGYNQRIEKKAQETNIHTGEEVVIKTIVDGDTVITRDGRKIRLIGIDTPERGEPYYSEAKARLITLIKGKDVVLAKDISETDRYGRLLRHIYIDDTWINALMIEEGMARLVTFPPDVMHVEYFRSLQKQSREERKGLWE